MLQTLKSFCYCARLSPKDSTWSENSKVYKPIDWIYLQLYPQLSTVKFQGKQIYQIGLTWKQMQTIWKWKRREKQWWCFEHSNWLLWWVLKQLIFSESSIAIENLLGFIHFCLTHVEGGNPDSLRKMWEMCNKFLSWFQ